MLLVFSREVSDLKHVDRWDTRPLFLRGRKSGSKFICDFGRTHCPFICFKAPDIPVKFTQHAWWPWYTGGSSDMVLIWRCIQASCLRCNAFFKGSIYINFQPVVGGIGLVIYTDKIIPDICHRSCAWPYLCPFRCSCDSKLESSIILIVFKLVPAVTITCTISNYGCPFIQIINRLWIDIPFYPSLNSKSR